MTFEEIRQITTAIGTKTDHETINAANVALIISGEEPVIQDLVSANTILRGLLQQFLDDDDYLKAGALLWHEQRFNPNPQYTKDVFEAILQENQLLLQGSNSTSKTYSGTVFMYLDWRRDPEYTMIKMAAVNENHLKRTLMADIQSLHRDTLISSGLNIVENEMFFGLDGLPDMGIAGILMPMGAEGTGRIRGYKPKALRKEKHPRFGYNTRVRFYGDEAQIYKSSVFKDFGSMQASMNGPDPVKIILSFNPDSTDRPVVHKAMPKQGWLIDDLDTLYRWISKEGWSVLRLDGARCENVVQRREVFPGLQTFEGFMKFVHAGGDSSADYYEKARGFPPLKGAVNIVIPTNFPNEYRGTANFTVTPIVGATVDCAYQGEDGAIMTLWRYGLASGWFREDGRRVEFTDYFNPGTPKHRHVLQYDQQIALKNREDTVKLAEEIMDKCRNLKVDPKFLGIDGTGNGFGTYSSIKNTTGFEQVMFIQWASKATELKVMNEDKAGANAIYDTIISEMWFTVRRWFEGGNILISPVITQMPLNQQLTTRRFSRVRGGLLHVESKREYKARGNINADESDSFIQAPLVVRSRHPILPGLHGETVKKEEEDNDNRDKAPDESKNLDTSVHESARHIYEPST